MRKSYVFVLIMESEFPGITLKMWSEFPGITLKMWSCAVLSKSPHAFWGKFESFGPISVTWVFWYFWRLAIALHSQNRTGSRARGRKMTNAKQTNSTKYKEFSLELSEIFRSQKMLIGRNNWNRRYLFLKKQIWKIKLPPAKVERMWIKLLPRHCFVKKIEDIFSRNTK